jgi:hypothetical protein
VVLTQIDEYSGYLGRPELCYKFVHDASTYTEQETGLTRTLCTCLSLDDSRRDGMVKFNGIRVELGRSNHPSWTIRPPAPQVRSMPLALLASDAIAIHLERSNRIDCLFCACHYVSVNWVPHRYIPWLRGTLRQARS